MELSSFDKGDVNYEPVAVVVYPEAPCVKLVVEETVM
jgi:hypothetical protein